MSKYINLNNEDYMLKIGNYQYNNRLAIWLEDRDGNLSDFITINLPECLIFDLYHGFINGDLSNEFFENIKDTGIIHCVNGKVPYNMGMYYSVIFDNEKLQEYDPDGYARFLEKIDCEYNIKI